VRGKGEKYALQDSCEKSKARTPSRTLGARGKGKGVGRGNTRGVVRGKARRTGKKNMEPQKLGIRKSTASLNERNERGKSCKRQGENGVKGVT